MLRQIFIAGTFLAGLAGSIAVQAAEPAPAAATSAAYSSTTTPIGTLLDDATTKAILTKYIPDLVSNPQIEMARGMTLKQVQAYSADTVTDEVLAKIDADLSKLPATK